MGYESTDQETPYILSAFLRIPKSATAVKLRSRLIADLAASLRNKSLEAYNIVVGYSTQPFLSFTAGEWLLCLQVIAEPICGLDLSQYLDVWQTQTWKIMLNALEIVHKTYRNENPSSSGSGSGSGSGFEFQSCASSHCPVCLRLRLDSKVEKVYGVEENIHCISSMLSWRWRTEIAVVEDIPFLAVKDGMSSPTIWLWRMRRISVGAIL
ncbi:uncharacterized protein BDV17DRAFT_287950 [Aspergillus undulatus]|uniref:uncharacterized protein n=1 Tax=Aspergillus undulatus TaxID=1810928 RepID=UPI003CCCAEE7